jgi:MtN3 and saliva related transmembrane protein
MHMQRGPRSSRDPRRHMKHHEAAGGPGSYSELRRPEKIISISDVIGWLSTLVLLATICRQVYSQWKSKATSGVSRWLFVGQITASIGFICYSYRLHNWIFLLSNTAMLITAVVGEIIYISNRKGWQKAARRAAQTDRLTD